MVVDALGPEARKVHIDEFCNKQLDPYIKAFPRGGEVRWKHDVMYLMCVVPAVSGPVAKTLDLILLAFLSILALSTWNAGLPGSGACSRWSMNGMTVSFPRRGGSSIVSLWLSSSRRDSTFSRFWKV